MVAWIATTTSFALFVGLTIWAVLIAAWGNAVAFAVGAVVMAIAAVALVWPK